MKDVYKHYKKYTLNSRKQTQYLKDNFSFDKMGERLNSLLPEIKAAPKLQELKLPNLELPKLKKVQ
jgi:hypothetical protein